MLFPSQHQAVRVQSNDAQTRLDRKLYTSTAANPSFELCRCGKPQMQFSCQLAPTNAPATPRAPETEAEPTQTVNNSRMQCDVLALPP